MAKREDPFHPLGDHLPRRLDADSKFVRNRLLHAAVMQRGWIAALERALVVPDSPLTAKGHQALRDIQARLATHPSRRLTDAERRVITAGDIKKPCKISSCTKLAHFQLGPFGWCREHEDIYQHTRRVWYQFAVPEVYTTMLRMEQTDGERASLRAVAAARNRFRRKHTRR